MHTRIRWSKLAMETALASNEGRLWLSRCHLHSRSGLVIAVRSHHSANYCHQRALCFVIKGDLKGDNSNIQVLVFGYNNNMHNQSLMPYDEYPVTNVDGKSLDGQCNDLNIEPVETLKPTKSGHEVVVDTACLTSEFGSHSNKLS